MTDPRLTLLRTACAAFAVAYAWCGSQYVAVFVCAAILWMRIIPLVSFVG